MMPGPGTWSAGDVLTAADLNAIGVWTSYTPTLTQSVARTVTVNHAEYCQINKLCAVNIDLTCTTTGSLAEIRVSMPFNFSSSSVGCVGSGFFFDSSANTVTLIAPVRTTSSQVAFYSDAASALLNTTLGANDVISLNMVYQTV